MAHLINPFASPRSTSSPNTESPIHSRLVAGIYFGAKWSLFLAIPVAFWVFYLLYRINTTPIDDSLTDKQLPNPLTALNLCRCLAGAVVIPLITIVIPASAARGVYFVWSQRFVTRNNSK